MTDVNNSTRRASLAGSILALAVLAIPGCGQPVASPAALGVVEHAAPAAGEVQQIPLKETAASVAEPSPPAQLSNTERLVRVAQARSRVTSVTAHRIGPGDLLDVRVFNLPEMTRTVRVAADGSIQLPLIGVVQAQEKSPEELSALLVSILSTNLVRHPQVDVFVTEYTSQRVAVTGAVYKPGLYALTKDRYSILDVISEAGGLTKEAGSIVDFVPAEEGGVSTAFQMTGAGAKLPLDPRTGAPGNSQPIHVDLNELFANGNRTALDLPIVAGDVVYVPEAGSFTIEGWIDKPGTYPLTHDTTVLAALSTGGGPLLPAQLSKVQILRSQNGATSLREAQIVNLEEVRSGRASDVVLRSGDIVRVPGSAPLMVPWGAYTFVKSLISIGASIPIL